MSLASYNDSHLMLMEASENLNDQDFFKLYENTPCILKHIVMEHALQKASLEKVFFLLMDQNIRASMSNLDIFTIAINSGRTDLVRALHKEGLAYNKVALIDLNEFLFDPIDIAILSNDYEMVLCLHSLGYELKVTNIEMACISLNPTILRYLISNKCPRFDSECYLNVTNNTRLGGEYQLEKDKMSKDAYACARLLHNDGCKGFWGCEKNRCDVCHENKKMEVLVDIWIMEDESFVSTFQWLPREIFEDVVVFVFGPDF